MNSFCPLQCSGNSTASKPPSARRWFRRLGTAFVLLVALCALSRIAFAGVTASVAGTIKDPTGAVISGAQVTATNTDTKVEMSVTSNGDGAFSFPALLPGSYDVSVIMHGFKAFKKTGIVLNVNDVLTADVTLQVGHTEEVVTVMSEALHVETASTQLGEVIEDTQINSIPLNGRSYTDLLALQPGVANANSGIGGGSSSNNLFQSGGFQLPAVSGDEQAGNQSVNGMRESANGYLLNGISVQEYAFSGTAVVPNLDSLSEFRIITNNFDSEYGNFAGGQINVVTKNGTNALHGNVFEFLRNTDFDAAKYFDAGKRGPWQQNEFGGTVGGPIKKDKVFFFGDYQGNRKVVGVSTGNVQVPTSDERGGDFSAPVLESGLSSHSVQGNAWASDLQGKLGYAVTAGEPYYSTGCTSNLDCVFPNAKIPSTVISPISTNILAKGAIPVGDGNGNFSTSSNPLRLQDNKMSGRVDANLNKIGMLFGYYFFDQYTLTNPYPVATLPGFAATTTGRTQAVDIGDTKTVGGSAINEARIGFLRLKVYLNKPAGSISTNLSDLGFAASSTPGAITPLDPSTEGIPQMDFENFSIGVPSRVLGLIENTYQAADSFSLLLGRHSLKFGAAAHYSEMSEVLHNVENGYFFFNTNLETGVDFADFLLGAPGNFEQAQTPAANTNSFYVGAFAQDSWRARPNLTLNYGVRWDVISPWWEKHNEIETLSLGEQSVVFPNSPAGWVFPTDPGIPKTIAPVRYNNFAPRLGLAYSPSADSGFLGKLLGASGQTSVRLGYGMFFSAFEGGYDFSVIGDAPYGEFYSPNTAPMLLDKPYETRATGAITPSPYPFSFPPTNVSASNPDPSIPASTFGVVGTSPAFNPTNRVPYAEQYELSIQRQLTAADLITISYVGTQGHRLLITQEANPVNQAACLALYNPNPALSQCGPGAEPTSLRAPFGANFASEGIYSTVGKSSYNSAQASFQHKSGPLQVMVGYTYGQSMDTASAFGEQGAPMAPNFNPNMTRALSSFNIPQNLVVSYNYAPFDKLGGPKMLVRGWQLSGVTTLSKGLPVYTFENDDNSLLGTTFSGPLPLGIDTPNFSGGKVKTLDPRNNPTHSFFDGTPTGQFSAEPIGKLGTARRRFFEGPGINNFNTTLTKDTKFFDRYDLKFRAEFFNVFNHAQFTPVNGNFSSSQFGQAINTADPRIGQLALELAF